MQYQNVFKRLPSRKNVDVSPDDLLRPASLRRRGCFSQSASMEVPLKLLLAVHPTHAHINTNTSTYSRRAKRFVISAVKKLTILVGWFRNYDQFKIIILNSTSIIYTFNLCTDFNIRIFQSCIFKFVPVVWNRVPIQISLISLVFLCSDMKKRNFLAIVNFRLSKLVIRGDN